MRLTLKRRLAAATVAVGVALGGSAGAALACHGDGEHGVAGATATFTTFQRAGAWHSWPGEHKWAIVTSYLGLSADTVKADLKAGQTLAQIANATPNKSAQGLVDALVAPFKTRLDAAVAAHQLTTDQEKAILTRLNDKFTALVNAHWPWWWHHHD